MREMVLEELCLRLLMRCRYVAASAERVVCLFSAFPSHAMPSHAFDIVIE